MGVAAGHTRLTAEYDCAITLDFHIGLDWARFSPGRQAPVTGVDLKIPEVLDLPVQVSGPGLELLGRILDGMRVCRELEEVLRVVYRANDVPKGLADGGELGLFGIHAPIGRCRRSTFAHDVETNWCVGADDELDDAVQDLAWKVEEIELFGALVGRRWCYAVSVELSDDDERSRGSDDLPCASDMLIMEAIFDSSFATAPLIVLTSARSSRSCSAEALSPALGRESPCAT